MGKYGAGWGSGRAQTMERPWRVGGEGGKLNQGHRSSVQLVAKCGQKAGDEPLLEGLMGCAEISRLS